MRFCYGDKNHIRILEEAEFWKRQEAEHTVVIREAVPDLEEEYVKRLKESQAVFSKTEGTIVQYIENLIRSHCNVTPGLLQNIICLIDSTIRQSEMFVGFLNRIIRESAVVKNSLVATTVINHIIRESEYYIGIAKAYLRDIACR